MCHDCKYYRLAISAGTAFGGAFVLVTLFSARTIVVGGTLFETVPGFLIARALSIAFDCRLGTSD